MTQDAILKQTSSEWNKIFPTKTFPKRKKAIQKSSSNPRTICHLFHTSSDFMIENLLYNLKTSGNRQLQRFITSPIPAASIRGVSCRTESDVLTAARLSKRKLTIPHMSWKRKKHNSARQVWMRQKIQSDQDLNLFKKIQVSRVAFVALASYVRKTTSGNNPQYTASNHNAQTVGKNALRLIAKQNSKATISLFRICRGSAWKNQWCLAQKVRWIDNCLPWLIEADPPVTSSYDALRCYLFGHISGLETKRKCNAGVYGISRPWSFLFLLILLS